MEGEISPSDLERDLLECSDPNAKVCPLPHPCTHHWEKAQTEIAARASPLHKRHNFVWADEPVDADMTPISYCHPPTPRPSPPVIHVPKKSSGEAKAVTQTKRALRGMAYLAKVAFQGLPSGKRQTAELILEQLTALIESLFDSDDDTPSDATLPNPSQPLPSRGSGRVTVRPHE